MSDKDSFEIGQECWVIQGTSQYEQACLGFSCFKGMIVGITATFNASRCVVSLGPLGANCAHIIEPLKRNTFKTKETATLEAITRILSPEGYRDEFKMVK